MFFANYYYTTDKRKVNVKKDALLKALQKVSNIIGSRTTLPVLANVLLEAENGKLTLTTTDLELRIITSIEAEVEAPEETAADLSAEDLAGEVDEVEENEEEILILKQECENKSGRPSKEDKDWNNNIKNRKNLRKRRKKANRLKCSANKK